LDKEALIIFSATMDKKIELLNFIILEVEHIDTKEQYRLSNSIL